MRQSRGGGADLFIRSRDPGPRGDDLWLIAPEAARRKTTGDEGRVRGFDGLRAVAVTAVLLFHAGAGFFGGGMLGVDVFFALSGYLITGMLLDDRRRSGSVHLGRFYARRARRLLPALLVLVIGVAAYANWLAGAEVLSSIRGDALSTLGYVSNWRFIFSDQGYFVHFGPPSPLLHTWSLAVEEQFYLVWPVVALFVMRRGSPWRLAAVAGGGAIASLLTSTVLFELGASSARLYYATDTRAQAILVGACLGALQPVVAERLGDGWHPTRRVRLALSTAGVGALGFVVWAVHNLTNDSALLYRGGFFLVATATSVLVAVNVFHPGALVARALSWAPLTYVGRISYGLYLYHWPIFLALDSQRSGLSGSTLLAARLGATFAVAAVSFHFLEQPIRTGRFPSASRWAWGYRPARRRPPPSSWRRPSPPRRLRPPVSSPRPPPPRRAAAPRGILLAR